MIVILTMILKKIYFFIIFIVLYLLLHYIHCIIFEAADYPTWKTQETGRLGRPRDLIMELTSLHYTLESDISRVREKYQK